MKWITYAVLPFLIAVVLTPIINKIALKLDIYAHTNERTVHTGKIARVGGVAIYVAFLLAMSVSVDGIDAGMRGMLFGGSIMFFAGLLDDMMNLSPWVKMGLQILATFVLIAIGGVELGVIHLPFNIVINMGVISLVVTLVWVVGITNAINLIDGLDGLAAGVSSIVLLTISATSFIDDRNDIGMISMILAGACLGFLIFNIHPAKIFMGDCGSLFLGFMIASISLMGFKGSTFITLGFPILLLTVPIVDTLSAMLRRILSGKSFTVADRSHFHHNLMKRFGHAKTVYIIYGITIAFGASAYIYILNPTIGIVLVFALLFCLELFVEKTKMINERYHPILSIIDFVMGNRQRKPKKEE